MWHQRFAACLLLLAVWTCDSASVHEEEGERGSKSSAERVDRLVDIMTASREPQLPPLNDKLLRDSEGYYLAFRLTAGIKKSAYAEYTNAGYSDDESDLMYHIVPCGCKSTNGNLYCDRHYRSMLMDLWPHLPVEKVKVSVYKAGKEKRRFVFDGRDSDSLSFFEQARLQEDQYRDLSSTKPDNPRPTYFSISGDANAARRFFINNKYNYRGCKRDIGWLVVADSSTNFPCPEKVRFRGNYPLILYSTNGVTGAGGYNLITRWWSGVAGVADVLTVSIKLRKQEECPAGRN